jgi:hypothetical protein
MPSRLSFPHCIAEYFLIFHLNKKNSMKYIFFFICLSALSFVAAAQPRLDSSAILYGVIKKDDMTVAPYDKWFFPNYDTYQPDSKVAAAIKNLDMKGIRVQIFFGSWCGDSKREVPRFMKLLNDVSFPVQNVQLIGVGGSDSLYKQSPQQEEAGKGVFRVPVFIVYRNGVEVNRINEYPAYSLEKDLYAILTGKSYTPNYRSFETIKNWLANGALTDKNISSRSLAWQLKMLVGSENELNSLGYLLLKQGKKEEALKIFQVNANLYPESANIISSLGEGYYKTGDSKNAVQSLERALELNKDPQLVRFILKLLYEAQGLKR